MNNPDIGKLILRLALAVMMLFHGIAKLNHGVSGIMGMLEAHGLPGVLAYGVFVGEILAPLMVLVAYQMRVGAILIVVNMVFAIALAHGNDILALGRHGGWAIELQMFYLLSALALVFLGPGKYGLRRN